MRYGTIGTSWITDAFIAGAEIAGGMELTAVFSRNRETGRDFAERHGNPRVFTDLYQMAGSGCIDAVYIASPNALHFEQSKLFLKHGKHVICEKPITVTPDQYREAAAIAEANRLIYMEAIMMRHLPARAALLEALTEIGRITTARFDFSQLSSKYSAYQGGNLPNIFRRSLAAGCLMDLGIYCVYPALDLFGKPDRILASAGFLSGTPAHRRQDIADLADGWGYSLYLYPDKQVVLSYSKVGQSHTGSEILGDRGTVVIESISRLAGIRLICADGSVRTLSDNPPKAVLMSGEAAAFRRYVEHGCSDPDYRQAAALTMAVCETMDTIRHQAGINHL